MTYQPDVYVSFTTIPSRLHRIVRDSLLNLIDQDYANVKNIFLTVPRENMRGQKVDDELPAWLDEEPFASHVTVLRPEKDHGPIMKFIGAMAEIPKGALVFVCDDDRNYKKNWISRCVEKHGSLPEAERVTAIINGYTPGDNLIVGIDRSIFGIDLLLGFQGMLVSEQFLAMIDDKFDRNLELCCLRNDDDVVSVLARDNGFRKVSIPSGVNWAVYVDEVQDALSSDMVRTKNRHLCHARINPEYSDGLLWTSVGLGIASLVLILIVLVMVWWWFRHGKKIKPLSKPKAKTRKSRQTKSP